MKKLILIFALFPLIGKAQTTDINKQFKKYTILTYTGVGVTALGVITAGIGISDLENAYRNDLKNTYVGDHTDNIESSKNLALIGIGVAVIGVVIDMISVHHLSRLKIEAKGNGVAVNF